MKISKITGPRRRAEACGWHYQARCRGLYGFICKPP